MAKTCGRVTMLFTFRCGNESVEYSKSVRAITRVGPRQIEL